MSDNRILTTHVGSLARPDGLLDWMGAIDKHVAVDDAAFQAYLAKAVAEVVKQQEQHGVDIVSDGEFGKFRSWSFYVIDRLGGLVHSQRVLLALTQKGVSREDSYSYVQRNAMPVWRGEGDFLTLLKKDKDVSAKLSARELEELFDLGYHTKHVDTIFRRVFGRA